MKSRRRNLHWANIEMSDLDLKKLVNHFGQSNKAEGKSPKTIAWYREMLYDFIRYLERNDRKATLANLDIGSVREFIVHEQARGLSPYSIQGKTRALKVFASWLCNERYTNDNALLILKLPKVPLKLVEPLTSQKIDKLVSYQNPLTAIGSRNIAIFVILLDSGLRVSELCSLKYEDAHIEEGYVKVFGKGSKERIVPVGALAQKVLWRYVFHFRPEPVTDGDDYLFLTLEGKPLGQESRSAEAACPPLPSYLCDEFPVS